ncbi:MAG: bifunctional transcriptional activator/DNA repair enzyme protein Ada [Actinobacteria bacterium HGW-Actinobacteria-7]|nr:MAG: bifunctional transcriptional activator/DNA repair enzyme protein Ada [Actinobacteria bacterium HGW-Actinobacteria-7]
MPNSADITDAVVLAIAAIDSALADSQRVPSLAVLARTAAVAPDQLRRAFLAQTGLTPKAYTDARKAELLRDSLATGSPVTDALYGAGFGSTSRVYERHGDLLGMTPAAYRKGAPGETIRYALATSALGRVIVGLATGGVCFIAFGDDDATLLDDLATRFPRAEIAPAHPGDAQLVSAVITLVDDPAHAPDLPLDVRGTAFQQRVWRALTRIAPGETVTYGELARRIGSPSAVRAVAQACGSNPVAVAVPCHRVIGADGTLTGYRWGVERKRVLLERERR